MPDDIFIGYERALGRVGVDVWEKLPDPIRARILDAEMSQMALDRDPFMKLSQGVDSMAADPFTAYRRLTGRVGNEDWRKLSDDERQRLIETELSSMIAEEDHRAQTAQSSNDESPGFNG